jgi:porphobilinogen synthase
MRKIAEKKMLRLRRLRHNETLRTLIRETELSVHDLVCPLFIKQGLKKKTPISSMPEQFQLGLEHLDQEINEIISLGIPAVLLFGIPTHKDETGIGACRDDGLIQQAIRRIKKNAPNLLVISDICFCEYTSHGHCGSLSEATGQMDVDNDETLALLVEQSVSHARAGTDVIAPSGMMDGMVKAIRQGLDNAGFSHLPILSYSVKYASAFYGPFREAAEGAPQFGDRKTYQMDPANAKEGWREADLDVEEGADMLMIKPALSYLDVIYQIKQRHPEIPLCAYQVSGEYSMIKAAAEKNWLDEKKVALETLLSIKRAGADFIITYFAKKAAKEWL